LQFSAPISPGNSGGPLLDMDGKVVGITTFIKPGGQNLNFAIPVNEARRYFKTIPKMSMREFAAKLSKAYSYYKSARDAVYAQDLDGAIRYMREAVETDPTFIAGHIYLASLYTLTGRLDMSITQLKKAISADPENVDARNELGAAYFERRMFKPAIKEFERAIAIDSRNAMSYSNIAAAYEKQNNLDEAAKMLKEALRLDPDYAMAHKNLGWVYFRRGMVREAIAQTKKAILFDPYDSHTYYNLSWIYHEDGQYELAVKYCEKAMGLGQKIDPGYMEKLRPYRKTTAAAGGSEEVRSSFSDAEMRKIINKMDSETAELARLGADAYSAGKYHLALQYQKKALSRVQKGTAAYDLILELVAIDYLDIGLEYMNNGLFDPAIEYLNEGIFVINSAHSPFLDFMRVKAYEYLAFCHAEKGDKTKAEDYIRKVHSVSQEKAQVLKKKIHEEYGY